MVGKEVKSPESYNRAIRNEPSLGISKGLRAEPTLDEARDELTEAICRVASLFLNQRYGPLSVMVSQSVVEQCLKSFESNLSHTKSYLSIVFEDFLDRAFSKKAQNNQVSE